MSADPVVSVVPPEEIKRLLDAGEPLVFPNRKLGQEWLKNASLVKAQLRGADLSGVEFGTANVKDADFSDCDLSDCDLALVQNLQPHQLSGANLSRTKLPADVAAFPALANVATLSQNAGKMFLTVLLACIFVILVSLTTPDIQLLTNTGTAELPALAIKIPISIKAFFGLAPIVLLILSITAHLYLQRLWEQMAKLPAIFPDGVTVDGKTYPWLVNDLIRTGFPLLRRGERRTPLVWMQIWSFAIGSYGTVPLTIFWVFLRCLVRHDDALSTGHYWVLTLAVGWAFLVWYLNRITLWRNEAARQAFVHWWRLWQWPLHRWNLLFLIPALVVPSVTFWASRGLERYGRRGVPLYLSAQQRLMFEKVYSRWSIGLILIDLTEARDTSEEHRKKIQEAKTDLDMLDRKAKVLRTDPRLAGWLRQALWEQGRVSNPKEESKEYRWLFDFPPIRPAGIEEDTSALTDKWKEKERPKYNFPQVALLSKEEINKRASRGENLRPDFFILAQRNDKFRSELETYVRPLVKSLSFREGNLRFLQAHKAWLVNADFRGADMTGADFSETDLRAAKFYDPNSSTNIQLEFANLGGATLTGTDLSYATLTGADLYKATLTGADLKSANLTGTDLSYATLTGADLYNATLTGADLSNATLDKVQNIETAKLDKVIYSQSTTRWPEGVGEPPKGYIEMDNGNLVMGTYTASRVPKGKLNPYGNPDVMMLILVLDKKPVSQPKAATTPTR